MLVDVARARRTERDDAVAANGFDGDVRGRRDVYAGRLGRAHVVARDPVTHSGAGLDAEEHALTSRVDAQSRAAGDHKGEHERALHE